MRIKIIGDNLQITPRIKRLVNQKINQGLEKILPSLNPEIKTATLKVEKHIRWGYKINFDMWLPKKYHLYAESRQENLLKTLVSLREKLERQIKNYKGKIR